LKLTLQARDTQGRLLNTRAPLAVWVNANSPPAPEIGTVLDALDWIRRAQKSADSGDLNTALLWIENAEQLDPWNPEAFYLDGRYAFQTGDASRAAVSIEKAAQFYPLSERILVFFGEVFLKLGRAAEVAQLIERLPRADLPQSPQFHQMTARLLALSGHEGEAAVLYRELMDSSPGDAQMQAEFGCLLWRQGKEEAADAEIKAALKSDPKNVTAMLCSAAVAVAHDKIQEAVRLSSQAAALKPDDADVHAQIGRIQAQAHRWEAALESYGTAAKLSPMRADILLPLAETELQSGHGQEAAESLRRVLSANSSDPRTWQEISNIYARAGQSADAAAVLEQGAARAKSQAAPFFREAAGLRERQGEYGQALLDYEAGLQSLPAEEAARRQHELAPHLNYLSLLVKSIAERGALPVPSETKGGENGILVPGGLTVMGNILGLAPSALRGPNAAGNLLSKLVETIPRAVVNRRKLDPAQFEVTQYLQNYEALLRHMDRAGLAPLKDRAIRKEFVFPLTGAAKETEKTRRFLSFFGVKYSQVRGVARSSVVLSVKQDIRSQERLHLLRYLGVDIQDKRLREIRLTLGDETLPAILNAITITNKILGIPQLPTEQLLAMLASTPDAMRLYLALQDCPATLRSVLLEVFSPRELLDQADLLSDFGRFLDFTSQGLSLPGQRQSWEQLVGTQSPAAFLRAFIQRGNGSLVYTSFVLRTASPAVQQYFTASPQRLDELSRLTTPSAAARRGAPGVSWNPECVRLLRLLSADEQGLFLPIDRRFGSYLLQDQGNPAPLQHAAGSEPLRLNDKDLVTLLRSPGKAGGASTTGVVSTIELLKYIQDVRPAMLTDDGIDSIMKNTRDSAAFLDLIWNLDPTQDLLLKYLAYCREVARVGNSGWNGNRTRTSQSIFLLISLLRRGNVISTQTGRQLLEWALAALAVQNETEFLFQTSAFLSDKMLPEIGRPLELAAESPDLLLQGLAGRERAQSFLFSGNPLLDDATAERLRRMKAAIQSQRVLSIPDLLLMIRTVQRTRTSSGIPADALQSMARALAKIPAATSAAAPGAKGQAPYKMRHEDTVNDLEVLSLLPKPSPERIARAMQEAAAALDAELGIALLAHCYAYYGTPQTAALTYDPDFVRRHEFYPDGTSRWVPAEFAQSEDKKDAAGRINHIRGSLSGLGLQLHVAETGASARSFGRQEWMNLPPTLLSEIRQTPRRLQTERAQAYVALVVSLSRELLALRASDPSSAQWCDSCVSQLLSPLRKEQLYSVLGRGNFLDAISVFSPSELFLLGERYLVARGFLPSSASYRLTGIDTADGGDCVGNQAKAQEITGPTIERLRELIPEQGSAAFEDFEAEVEQYGPFLGARIGVTENSLRFCDPYEMLDNYPQRDLLFARVFDLKVRLAELGYAAALPASIGGILGEAAIDNMLADPMAAHIDTWNDVVTQIERMGLGSVRNWIEELLGRGVLTTTPGKPADTPEEFQ